MQSAWSESMLSSDRKKAIEELGRGRELTNQLRDLLSKSVGEKGLVGSEDLVMKIFNSFAKTMSLLINSDEVSQDPRNNNNNKKLKSRWDVDDRKSEGCIKSSATMQKDRSGCSKRRKCANSWTRDTPTLIDDGHAWRKYGQKAILHANHPRNYFRCTHKIDKGCEATKQVQKIEDNPPKYRTTYYGHHTCKNLLNSSQLDLDSTSNNDSSILISFENNNNLTNKHNNRFLSSFQPVKQESKEDHVFHSLADQLRTFESLAQLTVSSSADRSAEDVISGMLDSVDLDQLLEF